MKTTISSIIDKTGNDRHKLLNILHLLQLEYGYITEDVIEALSEELNITKSQILQVTSFYHYLYDEFKGRIVIHVNRSIIALISGYADIVKTLEKECSCKMETISEDGEFGLWNTSCIGMSDQEPAILINGFPFTDLNTSKTKEIISKIKNGKSLESIFEEYEPDKYKLSIGEQSVDKTKTYIKGPLLDDEYTPFTSIELLQTKISPQNILDIVYESGLQGRGGAGFSVGRKWKAAAQAKNKKKYVICNADEGEPGTFKDRVLLSEKPEVVFEGMLISAYAIGAHKGIVYLRKEYEYMKVYLEKVLQDMRDKEFIGPNSIFGFEIRIQIGAGAYVCGEASALLESMEGKRGEPREKYMQPTEYGYLGKPTIVNNVESFAIVPSIIYHGSKWYKHYGTDFSAGTKVLSIAGDCAKPGIYELPWGISINTLLKLTYAKNTKAVIVGGMSGHLLPPEEFDRVICYSDLSTGGAIMILNNERNLLKDVVLPSLDFFIDESCGSCSTCRNVPGYLREIARDMEYHKLSHSNYIKIIEWGKLLSISRCGLGKSVASLLIDFIHKFTHDYEIETLPEIKSD
ncbi:MAG: NAD(P)H-dependent oxidoreductase subunit E [Flavobacteriales bacterium]|nr:NAD(P)H-dependent oxidoreductase subunit E [Flavobacteriales bacterium]